MEEQLTIRTCDQCGKKTSSKNTVAGSHKEFRNWRRLTGQSRLVFDFCSIACLHKWAGVNMVAPTKT